MASAGPGLASATRLVHQVGDPTTLTGKVRLLSDQAAGIIAGNTSRIISNNSGAIISDNGGGLVSQARFGLLEASREFALADAVITLHDGSGATLVDERGQPLTVTTDATGAYTLKAVLPPNNLVLAVAIHQGGLLAGGTLQAMLPRRSAAARTVPIDTASSLGAAYVLGKFVQGAQATYDKLPASEADNLYADLAAAAGSTSAYTPDALTARVEALRASTPAVARRLDEIKALLLGQANLGEGRPADTVPIVGPHGLALGSDGLLYVGEQRFGRLRGIDAGGRLSTLADVVHGQVKQNFPELLDLLALPDGSLLVCDGVTVKRVAPDHTVSGFAGSGSKANGPFGGAPTAAGLQPQCLALGPDGTVYVGELRLNPADGPSRVLAVKDGTITAVPVDAGLTQGMVLGLAAEPDGALDLLMRDAAPGQPLMATLYRYGAAGGTRKLADGFASFLLAGALARDPDGTLYVATDAGPAVWAVRPDGSKAVVAGAGGPAATSGLRRPTRLLVQPDHTLLIADGVANVVWALDPHGGFTVKAGLPPGTTARADLDDLAVNAPAGALFDAHDALVFCEGGASAVRRFDGATVTALTAEGAGNSGDGGPAAGAHLSNPVGVARHGDELYVADGNNRRIRVIGADGTIRTLVGGGATQVIKAGERLDPLQVDLPILGLAVAPDGQVYWTSNDAQLLRLAKDGKVEVVAGGNGHEASSDLLGSDPALVAALAGTGAAAQPARQAGLITPLGLACDPAGNLLLADAGLNRVLRVTGLDGATPMLEPFAGAGLAALSRVTSGNALPDEEGKPATDATLVVPGGIAVDAAGNVYVGELGTVALSLFTALDVNLLASLTRAVTAVPARVRRIAPDGTITTIAGPGSRFFPDPYGEDALELPAGLAIAADGRLAIVDAGANLLRILPAGSF